MPTAVPARCGACREPTLQRIEFSMAFQPIVDIATGTVFAYEALVRGLDGASAASVLDQVNETNRYAFDQDCRTRAIHLAGSLGLAERGARLSINFMPGAVYQPEACLRATLQAARSVPFPLERLIFEVTEGERVNDPAHLLGIFEAYRRHRLQSAIDDFGAGYAGLNLLAKFQPDIIKLDMELTRGLDSRPVSQVIVKSILEVCQALDITVVAEGIETEAEARAAAALGITLMQGYRFARPLFEALPTPRF